MDFGDEMERTFAGIVAFLPDLLAAILILVVGYLVAKLLEKGTDALLERLRFDDAVMRGGVTGALERTGTRLDPSSVVAKLVFWVVMLVAIVMASDALGLDAVQEMFTQLVAYIPNVIAAVLILTLGMILGEFVRELVAASVGGVGGGMVLARVAKIAVITLAIFMALDQLQVAEDIVANAFTLLLGAIALAVGLAFGLGNRELAGEYTRRWVQRGAAKAQEMKDAAQSAARPAAQGGDGPVAGHAAPPAVEIRR